MTLLADVLSHRAVRDSARARLQAHYDAIRADIEERGLGGRIAEEALDQAKAIFDEAVSVVEEHPGAVGGTFAALVLWFLRNPIIAWIEAALSPSRR